MSEVIASLLLANFIALIFKIVWDWLKIRKENNAVDDCLKKYNVCSAKFDLHWKEIQNLYDRLEKIQHRLEEKINTLSIKLEEKFNYLVRLLMKKEE